MRRLEECDYSLIDHRAGFGIDQGPERGLIGIKVRPISVADQAAGEIGRLISTDPDDADAPVTLRRGDGRNRF
jgi:hypothetical protein